MRVVMLLAAPLLIAAPIGSVVTSEDTGKPKWFEVYDHRLVVTSAHEFDVNVAVEEAMKMNRMPSEDPLEALEVCDFKLGFRSWFDHDKNGKISGEVARRLVREQLDDQGRELRIEQVYVDDKSMIFIDHEAPAKESEIAEQVAQVLTNAGFVQR